MVRRLLALAGLSASLLLGACWDPPPSDLFLNETSEVVTLRGVYYLEGRAEGKAPVSVRPGGKRRLVGVRHLGSRFVLETPRCRYVYAVKRPDGSRNWVAVDEYPDRSDAQSPIVLYAEGFISLKPDFTVQLKGADRGKDPALRHVILLRPIERQCIENEARPEQSPAG